jgi:hypothetical protein
MLPTRLQPNEPTSKDPSMRSSLAAALLTLALTASASAQTAPAAASASPAVTMPAAPAVERPASVVSPDTEARLKRMERRNEQIKRTVMRGICTGC